MVLALQIAFAAAIAVVALSLLAVVTGRATDRLLLALTIALAGGSVVGVVALGIDLANSFTDTNALLLAAGGLGAAAIAEAGLLALNRGLRRLQQIEALTEAARAEVHAYAEEEARERILELERMLARERANTSHQLSEQERRLAEERRNSVERQTERARVELTQTVASVQERLEHRLMAWARSVWRSTELRRASARRRSCSLSWWLVLARSRASMRSSSRIRSRASSSA